MSCRWIWPQLHPYDNPERPEENPLAKIARAATKDGRPPMSVLLSDAPPGLQHALEHMIQPERDDRPASAEELVGAFKAVIKSLGHDADDARKELGQLVNLVFDHGPPTITEMQGFRESSDVSAPKLATEGDVPNESAARPISRPSGSLHATDGKPVAATTPLENGAQVQVPAYPATAPLPLAPAAVGDASREVHGRGASSSRGVLLLALAGAVLVLTALVAFGVVFFWPASPATDRVEDSVPAVPDEPLAPVAPVVEEAVASDEPPSEVEPPSVEEPPVEPSVPPPRVVERSATEEPAEAPAPRRTETRPRERASPMQIPRAAPVADPRGARSRENDPGRGAFGL